MSNKLKPSEIELKGSWKMVGKAMQEDDINKRIKDLIKQYLKKITTDESGWEVLYIDPSDKRYWELTYSNSEVHGGGALNLRVISENEARRKYTFNI